MAVKKLTAAFTKNAAAEPGAERTVYWDEGLPGFGLMVTKTGHRSFIVQYRAHRASRRYTINAVLGLDDARKEARAILGKVARGGDPVVERRKAGASSKTGLRAVCERYLAREGGKLRTTAKRRATLERLIYPKMGALQIEDIRRSDIRGLLDDIEDQRGAAMADQVLALLRRIMNWHAARDDDFVSPIVRGMARRESEARERDRILTDGELLTVWNAAENYAAPWGFLVKFLLLTACRRTEAAAMTRSELQGDLWVIPATRYKTGTEVTLPLSTAAQGLLDNLPRIEGCDYLFTTDGRRPVSGFSTFKLKFDIACGVKNFRLHDLRRTARSLMARAGVNHDIAERCLGHAIQGVRGVYDRHTYVDEMRGAFEKLAALIGTIIRQEPNVVPMERRRGIP
jgi:integrase